MSVSCEMESSSDSCADLINFANTDWNSEWGDFQFDLDAFDEIELVPAVAATSVSPAPVQYQQLTIQQKRKPVKSLIRMVKKCTSSGLIASLTPPQEPILKFYSFPTFDKSQALMYLPSTYARLANSGNIEELTRLMKGYCQKECSVTLGPHISVSVPFYMSLLGLADILHADSMMCMHSTKIVDNQIQAVLYSKYTDVPEMYNYADSVVTNPEFKFYFVGSRIDILSRNLRLDTRSEITIHEILELLRAEAELQIYGKLELTITFDPYTKKFLHVRHKSSYTSVSHSGVDYPLD